MTTADKERAELAERLYEQYGKPFEAGHWGKYVAIFPDGRTVISDTVHEVVEMALASFGRGSFVFKIGPRTVWTIR